MSSYPLLKYVDSPATTAVVRYDFNDQNPNPATNPAKKVTEFDPGVPTLEGDPDAVGQQWGFRSPQIVHTIKGTKAQAMAALSAVSKEQLRRTNWLLFQPSAAQQPVWFKTYRTGYQPITLDQVWVRVDGGGQVALPDTWKITVPVVADAFTYAARVTMSTFQVIQGPADLTTPTRTAMRVVLPAIKGDARTPLRITISPAGSGANNALPYSNWLIGCIAGSASMTDTVIDIGTGDTVTNISGTGAAVTDATYFGGSYRLVTIGSGVNLVNRFSMTLPNTVQPGRYKVLMRCRYTGGEAASKPHVYRLQQYANGVGTTSVGPTASVTVLNADTNRAYWVDLGEVTFPFGVNPPTDAGGTMPTPTIAVQIGTSDASASFVTVDSIKLVPVDGSTVTSATLLKVNGAGIAAPLSATIYGTFDGDLEAYWGKTTAGVYIESGAALQGGFPMADPAAAQNLLVLMAMDSGSPSVTGTDYITKLNAQVAVDISYYPRYLHVGDGT